MMMKKMIKDDEDESEKLNYKTVNFTTAVNEMKWFKRHSFDDHHHHVHIP